MSLSDQIKQPGQIIGGGDGVGGGATTDLADWPAGLSEVELGYVNGVTSAIQTQLDGKAASSHTHAASDLTTGQVALARGGTNADLSATGGTGHVLKQSSAGANITVGALTASDIPDLPASKITSGQFDYARMPTMYGGLSTGTSSNYAVAATGLNLTDGATIEWVPHVVNSSIPTLNVNGTGAKTIAKRNTVSNSLVGGEFAAGYPVRCTYNSNLDQWVIVSDFIAKANDIPSTLNATTFAGAVTLSGNISSAGSSVRNIHGNGNANDWVLNCPTGGGLSLTVNGSQKLVATSTALQTDGQISTITTESMQIISNSSNGNTKISGGNNVGNNTAAESHLYGTGSTYPGAHQSFAPLTTRAASTAIPLCPVATGDMTYVTILESSIASCKVKVDTSGTVTFTDLDGNAASASIVNSSSPAAAEYGVYISAGVLYFKGGSSYAGKMASFPQIGKA